MLSKSVCRTGLFGGKGECVMRNELPKGIVPSILIIILGVVFFFRPAASMGFFVRLCGLALIIYGAYRIYGSVKSRGGGSGNGMLISGIICVVAGIIFLFSPGVLITFLPMLIGIGLIVDSIGNIRLALGAKKDGYDSWKTGMALSVIKLIFGIVVLFSPFRSAVLFMRIIGAMLIYSGIMNIYNSRKFS